VKNINSFFTAFYSVVSLSKAASSRDTKVERIKLAMQLLASRGYFRPEDLGIKNVSIFEWYCYQAGGVAVKKYEMFRKVNACISRVSLKV
jgi:hypothetical protein